MIFNASTVRTIAFDWSVLPYFFFLSNRLHLPVTLKHRSKKEQHHETTDITQERGVGVWSEKRERRREKVKKKKEFFSCWCLVVLHFGVLLWSPSLLLLFVCFVARLIRASLFLTWPAIPLLFFAEGGGGGKIQCHPNIRHKALSFLPKYATRRKLFEYEKVRNKLTFGNKQKKEYSGKEKEKKQITCVKNTCLILATQIHDE